ncbi:MAG: phospholipase D family protein [Ottowia sp.]
MSQTSKTPASLSQAAPTMRTAAWAITDFLSAVERVCAADKQSRQLRMYFYAATESGWKRIRKSILNWRQTHCSRAVTAYIGTDHALTDAAALDAMQSEGVDVRLMRHYTGTFHPKVIWFVGDAGSTILAGSNNLTEDGLRNNIEFATVTTLAQVDANLQAWHEEIHKASEPATAALIKSYAKEKEKYGQRRATSGQGGDFTWSKRTSGASAKKPQTKASAAAGSGGPGLILEVMPRETSKEGRQVQIPLAAARRFFGLGNTVGSSINLELNNADTQESRKLAFTLNRNSTARLSIHELEYGSRPCVLIFTKRGRGKFDFEVVRRAIDPSRFDTLIAECKQTPPDRRWKL